MSATVRNHSEGVGPPRDAKMLGAYYTDAAVADFLAWWAIRSPADTVLDPSFGGGVFLRSGCKRLNQLGGRPHAQVYGVEIDPGVHKHVSDRLVDDDLVRREHLVRADFFSIDPAGMHVDAAIGNPPFIRYQRFNGELRKQALARSLAQWVRLPELCSSWAPFLVHTTAMLRPGGRLAMVLPMELTHARYALPVLDHIRRSFASATFLTFRERLFPDLNEDKLLLLASDFGRPPAKFLWRELADAGDLLTLEDNGRWPLTGTWRLDAPAIAAGEARLIEHFIAERARRLYHELKRSGRGQRLGELADVGIGYVTGANDFFHLDPEEVERRGIPREFLKPAVRKGRALSGLCFTTTDWERAVRRNDAGYLLHIEKGQELPTCVRDYLREGETLAIPAAYKCRTRSPWYCVPHVYHPDGFLTYMSGAMPRLVANNAGVHAPNTLHIVRRHPATKLTSDALAALWQTSLTRLSVEIEGHALGGGMLKLEPTEAENVLVAVPDGIDPSALSALAAELDELARAISDEAARRRADEVILQGMMGLDASACALLNSAAVTLRARRGYGEPSDGPT